MPRRHVDAVSGRLTPWAGGPARLGPGVVLPHVEAGIEVDPGRGPVGVVHSAGEVEAIGEEDPSHGAQQPTDWSFRSDQFQRLVEIFQVRGNYEYDGAPYQKQETRAPFAKGHSVRDALARGHRLGIIASPDHGGGLGNYTSLARITWPGWRLLMTEVEEQGLIERIEAYSDETGMTNYFVSRVLLAGRTEPISIHADEVQVEGVENG